MPIIRVESRPGVMMCYLAVAPTGSSVVPASLAGMFQKPEPVKPTETRKLYAFNIWGDIRCPDCNKETRDVAKAVTDFRCKCGSVFIALPFTHDLI